MTIEYKDSKRIVKLSTDTVETITLDEDFSSYSDQTAFDNAWVSLDTAKNRGNPTNDNLDVVLKTDNSDDTMAYNLGSSLSDSAWVCRFKWNITGLTRNNTSAWHGWIGLSSTNQTGEFDDSQDSMGLTILTQNTGGNTMFWYASGSSAGAVNEQNSQFDDDVSTGTYYIEMIRNADVITVNVYTDSNYTTLLDGGSNTITGTVTGLQYFKVANKTGNYSGTITSTIDDLKIWNGVTSISSKPTNVQDNSLLVEKDTANRYWFNITSDVTHSSLTTISASGNLLYSARRYGCKLTSGNTAIGQTATGLSFNIQDSSYPSGAVFYYKVYRSDNGTGDANTSWTQVATTGAISESELPASYAWLEKSFTTPVTLALNDVVCIEAADVGSSSAKIQLAYNSSSSNISSANVKGVFRNNGESNQFTTTTSASEATPFKIIGTTATWNIPSRTPAEIGDLKVHYDATVGVTASSNSVSAWADQSGNGKTLSSVSNPTRVEAGQNGKDYLDFNSAKSMRATGLSETTPRPFTMVLVINPRNGGSQSIIRWSQNQYLALYQNPANTYYMSGGDSLNLTDSTLDGSWNAFFMDFKSNADGGTFQINLDTANAVSGTLGTNGTTGTTATLHVGINADNNNWQASCRYAEIIMFNKVLTAYEKEQLYGHLKTKWGLP